MHSDLWFLFTPSYLSTLLYPFISVARLALFETLLPYSCPSAMQACRHVFHKQDGIMSAEVCIIFAQALRVSGTGI